MQRPSTTEFIVDGEDFFVALTDAPGVRVGTVGGVCYDIPAGHTLYQRICESASERDAEDRFDELFVACA